MLLNIVLPGFNGAGPRIYVIWREPSTQHAASSWRHNSWL